MPFQGKSYVLTAFAFSVVLFISLKDNSGDLNETKNEVPGQSLFFKVYSATLRTRSGRLFVYFMSKTFTPVAHSITFPCVA